jgi:hypothetical protein
MNKCANCEKIINKKPDKRSKTGNVFCNSACSASFNNRIPKRIAKHRCEKCDRPIWGGSFSGLCGACYRSEYQIDGKTLLEVVGHRKNDANRYTSIRYSARRAYSKSGLPMKCIVCGYDVHVEICHVKGIAEFPDNALISEINDLTNLMALCRNHHWEKDHSCLNWAGGRAVHAADS